MILTIDVGNSNICIGLFEGRKPSCTTRIKTDDQRTEMEYALVIRDFCELNGIQPDVIEGAAISSVVPSLTTVMKNAVSLLGCNSSVIVGPGVKTGINIRIDEPASLGADLACTAVGAAEKYPLPAIIVDLGTATKITVITQNRDFIGGSIMPGVMISLEALAGSTSLLPNIGIGGNNIKAIGHNTIDCMLSGSILGTASMIDEMIDRFEDEIGEVATVVSCGGIAPAIIPYCKRKIIQDSTLLLDGLLAIYEKNKNK